MSFLGSDTGQIWGKKLAALKGLITDIAGKNDWPAVDAAGEALDRIISNLDRDINDLKSYASFIFSREVETESLTQQNIDLLRRWHKTGDAPSLCAMSIFTLEYFGIEGPEDMLQAILIAGVLGEVENDLDYHNNMHYRKVLLQTIRLAAKHNYIYAGTSRVLDDNQIGLLLMAACVHDLGHDGLGNTIKGVFHQGRLEKRSIEIFEPYLKAVGFDDPKIIDYLKIMILCTEVTPLDDPGNPMNQMKAAYRFHYLGGKEKTHTLNLDKELVPLQNDPDLAVMSLLLHEADIATSAGLSYEVTSFETTIYMSEIEKLNARPQYVLDFLNQICQRQLLSDAGQRLYASNLARIYAIAEDAVKSGDENFPEADSSEFLSSFSGHAGADTPKTIN